MLAVDIAWFVGVILRTANRFHVAATILDDDGCIKVSVFGC